jgi:hypothetical protein
VILENYFFEHQICDVFNVVLWLLEKHILQHDGFVGSHQTAPQVTILPRYLEVKEGSPVEFRCEATGNPAPTLQWTIGDSRQLNPEVSHME